MKPEALKELGVVTLATPCRAKWSAMSGDDAVRWCQACEKNVYNLSALDALEARALLQESEGTVCVRFFRRPDGTVLTRDCPEGVRARRHRFIAALATVVTLVITACSTRLPAVAGVLESALDTLGLVDHPKQVLGGYAPLLSDRGRR